MKWKWLDNKTFFWITVLGLVFGYLLLAYKNPFDNRSLIANLEPGPDTFLYIVPAWNWVNGQGLKMVAFGKEVRDTVPLTYGLYLAPFMKLFGDIRSFYFGNLVLEVGTVIFFLLACRNLFGWKKNGKLIILFLGLLLITNFYFFNEPVLAMAEAMIYFLISSFFYLISAKLTRRNLVATILIIGLTAAVKNTSLALSGLFLVVWLWKIAMENLYPDKSKRKYLWWLLIILGLVAGTLFYLKRSMLTSSTAFNVAYFYNNWSFYWNSLKGGPTRNLWYFEKAQTADIFVLSILGLLIGLMRKKYRVITVAVWLVIVLFIGAMSFFIDTEGRHVVVLLPLFLISAGVFLKFLEEKTGKLFVAIIAILTLVNLALPYEPEGMVPKIISLKQQIGLNFRHREDPWNYLCVQEVNQYFNEKDDDVYFGSFLSIYYFNIFGNHNYNYLPLNQWQDFMMPGRGLNVYYENPLSDLYMRLLKDGKRVYYSDYYASNGRELWRDDLEKTLERFGVNKVYQSKMDNCNIYQLKLKNE